MKKYYLILSIVSAVSLTACGKEIKNVAYYKENPAEAEKVVEQCQLEQGSTLDTNCINAKEALYQNHMNKLFER